MLTSEKLGRKFDEGSIKVTISDEPLSKPTPISL